MPPTLDVTAPLPVPALVTIRTFCPSVKLAVTRVASVTDTVQVPVPEQPPPDQPVKVEPVVAAAVSTTAVP
jgi:hypothetical protein